jgi:heme/copper-type cytochrome/quinol oxidase subunit 2
MAVLGNIIRPEIITIHQEVAEVPGLLVVVLVHIQPVLVALVEIQNLLGHRLLLLAPVGIMLAAEVEVFLQTALMLVDKHPVLVVLAAVVLVILEIVTQQQDHQTPAAVEEEQDITIVATILAAAAVPVL